MLRAFFRWNQRASYAIARWLPNAQGHTFRQYPAAAGQYLTPDTRLVVDVGGGKRCAYADWRPADWQGKLVAIDISPEELAVNEDAHYRLVVDGSRAFPFRDGSVDLMTSQSVLEHLPDVGAFVAEAQRVMRPGGYFVHWVPSKFAPFAIVNALLPNRIARKLLFFTDPGKRGICGFPVVYDRCHPRALARLFEAQGFEIVELRPSWFQSGYYAFFLPLFLASMAYEMILWALGARTLCAHFLIIARRRSAA